MATRDILFVGEQEDRQLPRGVARSQLRANRQAVLIFETEAREDQIAIIVLCKRYGFRHCLGESDAHRQIGERGLN